MDTNSKFQKIAILVILNYHWSFNFINDFVNELELGKNSVGLFFGNNRLGLRLRYSRPWSVAEVGVYGKALDWMTSFL